MNRADLQKLAEERLADAQVLLAGGRFGGAYYFTGYVVECALKACVAKLTKSEDFPDLKRAREAHTHALENLSHAAGVDKTIQQLAKTDRQFRWNWGVVNRWTEASRYQSRREQEAREMLAAVSDPSHGVLQCIKRFW